MFGDLTPGRILVVIGVLAFIFMGARSGGGKGNRGGGGGSTE